ncbi:Transmembrane protein 184C [Hondaea fermentalgiana]|uniref:Transmembrane protein 184C n=1 Tax=Hondaea fermentalgiana TaxID=2315210 RepID=A0A2R5GS36_9STRA|nr:Transmembrane protein 184C [Hondaea fermentalgiana]|eukprot:GBG33405.1 Transmembrane protein 184C [Hondaea fermentalgiana]
MDAYSVLTLAHLRAERMANLTTVAMYGVVLVMVSVAAVILTENGMPKRLVGWCVAGIFMMMALPLTTRDINDHLRNFEFPELQKYIVRILFMIPIYSVTSWLSLGNEKLYTYLESLRSLYEAYVIWSFLYFLMLYLGPTEEMLATRLESLPQQKHLFPLNFVWPPWKMGHEFLFKCKFGTLQYVVWKITNVLIVLITKAAGVYYDGEWRIDGAYFWSMGITNLSQLIAIYCLVLFYHVMSKELAPIKPLAKFLCIKAVVFFSFWQGTAISAMVYFGWIHSTPYISADTYAKGLQDLLICVEMFFFAVAHHFIFSYKDFQTYRHATAHSSFTVEAGYGAMERTGSFESNSSGAGSSDYVRALLEAANPRDLVHDIRRDIGRLGARGSFHGSSYDDYDNERAQGEGGFESAASFVPTSDDYGLIDIENDEDDEEEDAGDADRSDDVNADRTSPNVGSEALAQGNHNADTRGSPQTAGSKSSYKGNS